METNLLAYLAPTLRGIVGRETLSQVEEIRVRINQPLVLLSQGNEYGLNHQGRCTVNQAYRPTVQDLNQTLQLMANNSWYALEDQIRAGYLALPGGHRVGISGRLAVVGNDIKNLQYPQSLNIRIAREVIGCAQKVYPQLLDNNQLCSTLLISPPGCGKTTLLRDIARITSNQGFQCVIIDERSEIAACYQGVPQLDVGLRCDVIDGCPKSLAIPVALRGLSPDVIITDEIGHVNDGDALGDLARCGVKVITSCHGSNLEEVKTRSWARENWSVFERIIILSKRKGPGTVDVVLKL